MHIKKTLSFEISEVMAKKWKAYSDGELITNCLEVFTRRVFSRKEICSGATKSVSVYRGKAKR